MKPESMIRAEICFNYIDINDPEFIEIEGFWIANPDCIKVGHIVLLNKNEFILSKNGNTWNLTTAVRNAFLYDLSKNSDHKFYIKLYHSTVKYFPSNNSFSSYKSINSILNKEEYNLLLEFYVHEAAMDKSESILPLSLNLTLIT